MKRDQENQRNVNCRMAVKEHSPGRLLIGKQIEGGDEFEGKQADHDKPGDSMD
jgi:hypothetical protein